MDHPFFSDYTKLNSKARLKDYKKASVIYPLFELLHEKQSIMSYFPQFQTPTPTNSPKPLFAQNVDNGPIFTNEPTPEQNTGITSTDNTGWNWVPQPINTNQYALQLLEEQHCIALQAIYSAQRSQVSDMLQEIGRINQMIQSYFR